MEGTWSDLLAQGFLTRAADPLETLCASLETQLEKQMRLRELLGQVARETDPGTAVSPEQHELLARLPAYTQRLTNLRRRMAAADRTAADLHARSAKLRELRLAYDRMKTRFAMEQRSLDREITAQLAPDLMDQTTLPTSVPPNPPQTEVVTDREQRSPVGIDQAEGLSLSPQLPPRPVPPTRPVPASSRLETPTVAVSAGQATTTVTASAGSSVTLSISDSSPRSAPSDSPTRPVEVASGRIKKVVTKKRAARKAVIE
ncbi:hypothetical protein IWQ60_003373 [Tieghemiomyces parasiticus]|uniref:Uncharacterized protein n=1 Tax=Tieghemiomyces parasiticus TaxID=78921 RepID=A0A9W8AHL0_9FUNG|nr:hypothetical protein IWQ60_003373 [Tieghemiomyces parasiticus]